MHFVYFIFAVFLCFKNLEGGRPLQQNEDDDAEESVAPSLSNAFAVNKPLKCWTIKGKDVNSFRLFNGFLNFRVNASTARLSFYSTISSSSPIPTFEINLGSTMNDSVSAVHRYRDKYFAFITPHVLKANVFSGFWAHWDCNGNFAVGKEGEQLPFMAMRNFGQEQCMKLTQLKVHPSPMKGGKGRWLIQVPQSDDDCPMAKGNCNLQDSNLPENYRSLCEYLQTPTTKVNYGKPLCLCDGRSKEIKTPIDGQPSKFKYQNVKDVFNFGVKAEKHAELVFLENLKTGPVFTVVLAANEAPSTSSLWVTGGNRIIYDTPGIINKYSYTMFWVTWDTEGHIAMGYGTDTVPFMVTMNPRRVSINFVAFTTSTPGSFIVDSNSTVGKPVETKWIDKTKGAIVDCAYIGGYVCDDCELDSDVYCSDSIPPGAKPLYVVRAPHHSGVYPGQLLVSAQQAYIALDNVERRKDFYQVLVSGTLKWSRSKPLETSQAYPAGMSADKQFFYVCRAKTGDNCVPGYVAKNGEHCAITYNGETLNITKYDTLACTKDSKCAYKEY